MATAQLEKLVGWQGFLDGFSAAEREAVVRSLVAGLRRLPQQWIDSDAFRIIIIDLEPPLIKHGVPITLSNELSGTPAGDGLKSMRAHEAMVNAERKRRSDYESPQAAEERRRAKRAVKAREHAIRQSQTRTRNAQRLEQLATLARLPLSERLSRFANDRAIILDWVSPELIPLQASDLAELQTEDAVALVARIGQRKGIWGQLRRMIEYRLEAEPK